MLLKPALLEGQYLDFVSGDCLPFSGKSGKIFSLRLRRCIYCHKLF